MSRESDGGSDRSQLSQEAQERIRRNREEALRRRQQQTSPSSSSSSSSTAATGRSNDAALPTASGVFEGTDTNNTTAGGGGGGSGGDDRPQLSQEDRLCDDQAHYRPSPFEDGLEYGWNSADIAADNMAAHIFASESKPKEDGKRRRLDQS